MDREEWTCPYCQHLVLLSGEDRARIVVGLNPAAFEGELALEGVYVVCPNQRCRRFSLTVAVHQLMPKFGPADDRPTAQRLGEIVPSKNGRWSLRLAPKCSLPMCLRQ
jgi:hypothetical protein